MSGTKLVALALTALLATITGVASLGEPETASAASSKTTSWSGQTRTLSIWPTDAAQAVGAGVVEVRVTYPGTIRRVSVSSGWKVESQDASSFVLTNTAGFVARGWDRDAASSVNVRVDGNFLPEPSELEKIKGGPKLMTGDDLDRGRIHWR
jgi:hypothetical protein